MTETQTELGAEMRAARQAHGWELPQLAASLRIRQSYLEAIEAGRLADLPGTTYALGFVRAYASALGLPGEEMARRFRADTALAPDQTALRFPAPVPQRGLPAGALMLLGVFILVGAYGGWYWVTEHRATPVETVPPIPDRIAAETQKPAPSPQIASLLPSTAPPTPPADLPSAAQATTQPLGAAASSPPPAIVPAGPKPGPVSAPAPAAVAPAAPKPASPTDATSTRIVIRATANAWVTVRPKSGPPLLNRLLKPGDSWTMPAGTDGAMMTTGNAGGTQIYVDGAPIPTLLGGSGGVRRNVPMDADLLKSGKLPPPSPPAHPASDD